MKIRILIFVILFSSTLFAQFKDLTPQVNPSIKTELKISTDGQEKSKTLAFILSLAIPGLGEYYLNRFDVGQYFLIAEGGLWLSLYGFDYYGRIQKDNYMQFASVNGGVNSTGKDENYWAIIGSYMNIYDYNNEKLLNRQFNALYNENTHYWFWNSNEERKKYRNLWLSSESAFNNKQFPISLIIINHIASAINAVIIARNYNERLKEGSVNIYPQLGFDEFYNPQIKISLRKNF
jgi:hypothetical protein